LYDAPFKEEAEQGRELLVTLMASASPAAADPSLVARATAGLVGVAEFNVQAASGLEGERNVWVVKPAAKSRGRGIFCENRLDLILETISNAEVKEKYVAQKYIENNLTVRCALLDRNLHSRMPLVPTPARLKRTSV
jgi:hypothetical protein